MTRFQATVIKAVAALGLMAGALLAASFVTRSSDERLTTEIQAALAHQATAIARQSPTLIAPVPGERFDNLAAVRLQWDWHRPLQDDEFFDVRVWRPGDPPYGITWTKETSFALRDWLLDQTEGEFRWSIAVVKQNAEGADALELSDAADETPFFIENARLDVFEVPEGFQSQLVARFPFGQPSVVTFSPDGDLYVLGVDGLLAQMLDQDGDGYFETHRMVYENTNREIIHAVGLAFLDEDVYVSHAGQISNLRDDDGDGVFDRYVALVAGLPTWEHTFHSNNGIAFGQDGKLYIAVGSTTDHGPIRHDLEASILRMEPDGSRLEVYATGLRNAYDLVFSPDGDLFTADNSPDEMTERLTYLPPEELNHIRQGRHYGFPEAFGRAGALATGTEPPVTEFYTSVASAGLTYYADDQFPPEYHGIYVAQFGTGAPFPQSRGIQSGYEVVHVYLETDDEGSFHGRARTFARARSEYGNFSPIDVTVGPDGHLYIAEWNTSTLFRVRYVGNATGNIAPGSTTYENEGERLYYEGVPGAPACITCHTLTSSASGIGPSLYEIRTVAEERIPGLSAEDYLRQSILEPSAYVVSGYSSGVMFSGYGETLSSEQIDDLVTYIMDRTPDG